MHKLSYFASLCVVTGSLAGLGCNDDGSSKPSNIGEGDAYLVGTRVWDDTTTTSYFKLVDSLDHDVTLEGAIEVAGAAKVYAVDGIGWFAIGGGEEPTITRYVINDDNALEADQTISLADYGITSLWDTLYPVSATKMYYPDRDGQQLVIINPQAMTIEGSIPLPQTMREGYLANYGYAAIARDEKLLISVGWFDWSEEGDAVLGETGLIVLDTESDNVERFDVDDRCGGITQPIVTASGDTYLVSSALAAAAHELGRLPTPPCALRIADGEDGFDGTYLGDMGEITGATLVGEPVPASGDDIYVRVMDDDLATIEAGAATWELTGQAAWTWSRWNTQTNDVTAIDGLEPSTADVSWFAVEGHVYGTQTETDYSETRLFEIHDDGSVDQRLTATGFLHGIAKVR